MADRIHGRQETEDQLNLDSSKSESRQFEETDYSQLGQLSLSIPYLRKAVLYSTAATSFATGESLRKNGCGTPTALKGVRFLASGKSYVRIKKSFPSKPIPTKKDEERCHTQRKMKSDVIPSVKSCLKPCPY